MLPAAHRLRSAEDFRRTVRRGKRAGGRLLVAHLIADSEPAGDESPAPDSILRIGFVVARSVGPAVTRNRVKRRLRHLLRERLDSLPESGVLVLRALPASAEASYAELGTEVDRLLAKACR